jgi:hypothetical protein
VSFLATRPSAVPSLDALLAHPEQVTELSIEVAMDLASQVAGLLERLRLRALAEAVPRQAAGPLPGGGDHLLNIDAAAQRLAVSPDWIYRRSRGDRQLPFLVRLDGKLLCSAQGIERFIRQRLGR